MDRHAGLTRRQSCIAIVLVCGLFAISSAAERLEIRFGLPILFGLRNAVVPPDVPEKLFIVTPYRVRASNQPGLLRHWDRRVHANSIMRMANLDVSVLAIDIFFRDPHPGEDNHLANALRLLPNTVLVQNVRPFGGNLEAGIIENPVTEIALAVSRLALSQIAGTPVRNDSYALRSPILLEQKPSNCLTGLDIQVRCTSDNISAADIPAGGESVVNYDWTTASTLPLAAFELWSTLLESMENKSALIRKSDSPFNEASESGVSQLLLNLYGPPRTIPTLDYDELEVLSKDVESGRRENPLEGSVIFLGGSYSTLQSQREDGFNTVFSSNDRPMPGVEMAATAFANLRDGNALVSRIQPREALLLTLAVLSALFVFSRPIRTRRSLLLVGLCASGLMAFVSYWFVSHYVWLPFITPLLAMCSATAYIVLSDLRISNRLKEQARGELGNFVSDLVLEQLDGGHPHQLDQAICLVSDVRGFTAMSERFTAEALHEHNEQYFSVLFESVTVRGADVVKTYGDSMTAVWKASGQTQRTQALEAAADILMQTNLSRDGAALPITHIGICSGPVVVGYVGVKRRRSVELTGGAVYRASRLEQLNKSLGTMMLASEEFELHAEKIGLDVGDVGLHQLRGITRPIRVVSIAPKIIEEVGCAAS